MTAVVSLDDDVELTSAAITASVKEDLAGYKAPNSVVFVPQVLRAPNGKADYRVAQKFTVEAV